MNTRLKASALLYSLIIAVIVAVICSSLISISYLNKLIYLEVHDRKEAERNCYSAVNYFITQAVDTSLKGKYTLTVDLFAKGKDSVEATMSYFGLYQLIQVKAKKNNSIHQLAALGGVSNSEAIAVYLQDMNTSLSLSGKTFLKGTCYLPPAGVRRAYVEGLTFEGQELTSGEVKESQASLPPLKTSLLDHLNSLFYKDDRQIQYQDLPDTLSQKFIDSLRVFHYASHLEIKNKNIRGHILIRSDSTIHIDSLNHIDGALFVAPVIVVKHGFRGNLQAIASDSIVIEKNSRLEYPSSLCLYKDSANSHLSVISIAANSFFSGTIVAYCKEASFLAGQILVSVAKDSQVRGTIYSDRYVSVYGEVYGSVICRKFLHSSSSSVYDNYLINAKIDAVSYSRNFLAADIYTAPFINFKPGIVQWLR